MDEQIVKPATQAKQGRRGAPVLYVLTAGIALVATAFAAVWLVDPR